MELKKQERKAVVALAAQSAAQVYREERLARPDGDPYSVLETAVASHYGFSGLQKCMAAIQLLVLRGKLASLDVIAGHLLAQHVQDALQDKRYNDAVRIVNNLTRKLDERLGFTYYETSIGNARERSLIMKKDASNEQLARAIDVILQRQEAQKLLQRVKGDESTPTQDPIQSIDIRGSKIDNISCIPQRLPRLRELILSHSCVTDISEVAKLTDLKFLRLSGLKGIGLTPIRQLKKLQFLALRELQLPVNLFHANGPLTHVQVLDLRQSCIGKAGQGDFLCLVNLPNLKEVIFSRKHMVLASKAIAELRAKNPPVTCATYGS